MDKHTDGRLISYQRSGDVSGWPDYRYRAYQVKVCLTPHSSETHSGSGCDGGQAAFMVLAPNRSPGSWPITSRPWFATWFDGTVIRGATDLPTRKAAAMAAIDSLMEFWQSGSDGQARRRKGVRND